MIDIIYFELAAISLVDVALAIFIQRKITSVEKTYHLQNKMKKHMAELKELTDKKAPPEHLAAKQKEITQTMSDTMMHQFRATPVLLVLSVVLYFFVLPNLFPSPTINTLPIIGFQYHSFQQSLFFIAFTFVASLVTQLTLSSFDKKRFDAKYGANASAQSTTPTEENPPSDQ